MEPRIATVSQINGYIKKILDKNIILNNVWVKGELSNFKRHYSGHIYTTLKDEGGVLKAVMFRGAASSLAFMPQDGMKVLARGRVGVYENGGVYQLYIEEMIPDGVGELYIAYEQLKAKLQAEGLFDEGHKKPIPRFPSTVGVITAPTGAAVRDIINVITRRYPLAEIVLYPAQVQGTGAAESVAAGIKYFNDTNGADTIIAGRGGGSIEDLWAFNEEIVARAIFDSHIPIISAVGHETDFTIADFVADLRAPTPSAAAEIAVPSVLELSGSINMQLSRLTQAQITRLKNLNLRLNSLKLKTPQEIINDNSQRLDNLTHRLASNFKLILMQKKKALGEQSGKLNALSPLNTLSRGYAIPVKPDGAVVRSCGEVSPGDEFTLKLRDGDIECIVK
ncbi:MAG: exodeoxyribonuclease VII large subunit [Clostridia bacterium]|nr:exodeoxyribonuclease VII large subunit [Clostridia bacterium]